MKNNLKPSKPDQIYQALISAANESENTKIEDTYLFMKKVWLFYESDEATYNGKKIEPILRSLYVNPSALHGGYDWEQFSKAEVTYSSTKNTTKILEEDFIEDMLKWMEAYKKKDTPEERKFKEYADFLRLKLNHTKDANKEYHWFKIGLEFATDNYFQKYKELSPISHEKVVIELGFNKSLRSYFSETYNNSTVSNKNIFSNLKKMETINNYCLEKGIETCEKFNEALNLLQAK